MQWKDVGKAVAQAAPMIGNLLINPVGTVASAAGSIVAAALGVAPTADAVGDKISGDPQALTRIAELQAEKEIRFRELELEALRIERGDVEDARQRDIQIVTLKGHNYRADILAYGAMCAFIAALYLLFTREVQDGPARELLVYLTGVLNSILLMVYGFEFGASRSNGAKDEALANAVRNSR